MIGFYCNYSIAMDLDIFLRSFDTFVSVISKIYEELFYSGEDQWSVYIAAFCATEA